MGCSVVQFHPNRPNTESKRPEYPQGAWHNAKEDTKKAASCTFGQGRKAAADDLIGKRFFRRIWNGD